MDYTLVCIQILANSAPSLSRALKQTIRDGEKGTRAMPQKSMIFLLLAGLCFLLTLIQSARLAACQWRNQQLAENPIPEADPQKRADSTTKTTTKPGENTLLCHRFEAICTGGEIPGSHKIGVVASAGLTFLFLLLAFFA